MRYIFLIGLLKLYANFVGAQSNFDSTSYPHYDSLRLARYRWHFILFYDFHSTFTANAQTWFKQPAPKPQLIFYYNIDIKSRFQFRKWLIETAYFNDFGTTWYLDSLRTKSTDHLHYKLSIAQQLTKKISLDAAINTQTILFPGYSLRRKNDTLERFLNEGFMSPGFIYIASGIGISLPHLARLQIGLAGCKITTLRNSSLFDMRQENNIAGVPKGKKRKTEGGINAQITWPLTGFKERWFIEGTALLFVPILGGNSTFDINTVGHLRLWRFGRLSWRHQFQWNKAIQSNPTYQQWLTLGVYLNNKLK
jgi:hypothetical protein